MRKLLIAAAALAVVAALMLLMTRRQAPPPALPPSVEAPAEIPLEPPAVPTPPPRPQAAAPRLRFPATYDKSIKAAAANWLPGLPWQLWKAQLFQESKLNPDVVSHAGAAGIAQFMPRTWDEVTRELGLGAIDRRLAEPAIAAGAYYMMKMRRVWAALSDFGRHDHAMASYNAGAGNIRKAWQRCSTPDEWTATAACLPSVTGRYAAETTTYVQRIWRWYWAML